MILFVVYSPRDFDKCRQSSIQSHTTTHFHNPKCPSTFLASGKHFYPFYLSQCVLNGWSRGLASMSHIHWSVVCEQHSVLLCIIPLHGHLVIPYHMLWFLPMPLFIFIKLSTRLMLVWLLVGTLNLWLLQHSVYLTSSYLLWVSATTISPFSIPRKITVIS